MKRSSSRLAPLWLWLRRYWYPLLIVAMLFFQFTRLLLNSVTLEEWLAWGVISAAGVVSIRLRLVGLLVACGIFSVLVVSPINVAFSMDFIFFAVGYLCADYPAVWGISAGLLLGLATAFGSYPMDRSLYTAGMLSLLYAVPVAVGLIIANYRRLYESERVRSRLQLARQSQDFATEVHDSISHVLVQISILSEAKLWNDAQGQQDCLEQINGLSARGLREMRDLVKELQSRSQKWTLPAGGEKAPQMRETTADACVNTDFGSILQEFADALQRAGFTLELQIQGYTEIVPPSKTPVLTDCLREVSTNIMKYADATQPVVLLLRINANRVHLYCANEVKGEDKVFPSSGQGLVGIKRRVKSLGGQVKTGLDDATWSITVDI